MARILDRIDRPQDLHDLPEDELVQVAQEVREHIIDTVGQIGGHFGANLGTCELAVALHSLLDSPMEQNGARPSYWRIVPSRSRRPVRILCGYA